MLFLRLAGPWLVLGILLGAFGPSRSGTLMLLVGWLASAAVSVAWMRFILASASCPVGGNLGRRERRYILVALPIAGTAFLALTACYTIAAAAGVPFDDLLEHPWFLWLTAAVMLLAYHGSVARFVLMFPALSLDNRAVTWRVSLRLTRGSAVAILVGLLVASAPAMVPSITYWLPEDQPVGAVLALAHALDSLFALISAVVVASFSAQLYARQFGTVASVFD